MAKRQNFKYGDKIGKAIYLYDTEPYIGKNRKKVRKAMFKCMCNNEFVAAISQVKLGIIHSCGCYHKQRVKECNTIKYNIGDVINGFVYLGDVSSEKKYRHSKFICPNCNNEFVTRIGTIKNTDIKKCKQCSSKDFVIQATRHGMSRTPEYNSWELMRDRCYKETNESYGNYGGKGITVCDSWKYSFENFINDMGLKPGKNYTIDRINSNGHYTKENCKWATKREQALNRSTTVIVEINGIKKSFIEWVEDFGVNYQTARSRYRAGWPIDKVFARKHIDSPLNSQ